VIETEDTFKHQGLRRGLIEVLKGKGITNEAVLAAIGKIPRHLFFDKVFHNNFAYKDVAFPIGSGQTISQPYTVAFQSSLLEIKKGEKVLEIGTGCGYQTAVLLELGAKVYSIERQRELYTTTKPMLSRMGYRANLYFGDGFIGKKAYAPFAKIIVTCGAPHIPKKLLNQLAIGGKLIIPVGDGKDQTMTMITRVSETELQKETFGTFSFVPMLTNKQY